MRKLFLIPLMVVGLLSCTENSRVKTFGGTAILDLQPNQKLVNVTWKGEQLWYITKSMDSNDVAETYFFQEESSWGLVEGTYVINEHK